MSPTLEEASMRTDVVDRITEVIHSLWPKAEVIFSLDVFKENF